MKVNFLNLEIIKYMKNYKNNDINIHKHKELFCKDEILRFYFDNYIPYNDIYMSERIDMAIKKILDNYDRINEVIRIAKKHKLTEILKKLDEKEIIDELDINFFIGFDTCEAFPMLMDKKTSINIAIEKLIFDVDIKEKIDLLVIHEISHILRYKKNPSNNLYSLGDVIVEEGLACLLTQKTMNFSNNQIKKILPKGIKEFKYEGYVDIYLDNLNSREYDDIRMLMYIGSPAEKIPPGLGYLMGYTFLNEIITKEKLELEEILCWDNTDLIDYILKYWRKQ